MTHNFAFSISLPRLFERRRLVFIIVTVWSFVLVAVIATSTVPAIRKLFSILVISFIILVLTHVVLGRIICTASPTLIVRFYVLWRDTPLIILVEFRILTTAWCIATLILSLIPFISVILLIALIHISPSVSTLITTLVITTTSSDDWICVSRTTVLKITSSDIHRII